MSNTGYPTRKNCRSHSYRQIRRLNQMIDRYLSHGKDLKRFVEGSESHIYFTYSVQAKQLAQDLIAHAKEISNGGQTQTETFKIPPELRKAKVEQVMKFLERE